MLVHAPHPCKGDLFVPFGKLMSAQKKCIYSWENGNGALAYYRGGGVLVHALHPRKGDLFAPFGKLMSAQEKCIYSWENGNGV